MDPRSRVNHQGSRRQSSSNFFLLVCLCLAEMFLQLNHVKADGYAAMAESQALRNDASTESKNQKSDANPFSSEQEIDYKRSSSFFPLRGKKPSMASAHTPGHYPTLFDQEEMSSEDKRSHFYPLRGKKVPTELKRGSYFMPMRGRKDDEEAWWDDDVKRMSSFMPMRGKKGMLDSFQSLGQPGMYNSEIKQLPSSDSSRHPVSVSPKDNGTSAPENEIPATKEKRSVGFVPMRGKRSILEDISESGPGSVEDETNRDSFEAMGRNRYSDDEEILPSMADDQGLREDFYKVSGEDMGKRAYSFMPMRGRRDPLLDTHIFTGEAPQEKRKFSFTPMRGRREHEKVLKENDILPQNVEPDWKSYLADSKLDYLYQGQHISESNQQDKRASYFMPMRGRSSYETPMDEDKHDSEENSFPLLPFEHQTVKSLDDKKASKAMSFFPMRGRSSPSDGETFHFNKRGFMAMRGRRRGILDSNEHYFHPYPFFVPPGIGSSLMERQFTKGVIPIRTGAHKTRRWDWDSVKRAFHATRGKRYGTTSEGNDNLRDMETAQQESGTGCRCKRSARAQGPLRQYLALKRPMSFFATRGKRTDPAVAERQ